MVAAAFTKARSTARSAAFSFSSSSLPYFSVGSKVEKK
jgi:hypothetical protein